MKDEEELEAKHAESRTLYMHEYTLLVNKDGRLALDPTYFNDDRPLRERVRR